MKEVDRKKHEDDDHEDADDRHGEPFVRIEIPVWCPRSAVPKLIHQNLGVSKFPPSLCLRNARHRAALKGFGPIGLGRYEPLEVIDPNPDPSRTQRSTAWLEPSPIAGLAELVPGFIQQAMLSRDPATRGRAMSTIVILVIVIAAIIIVGVLISAASRRKRERKLGEAQVDAKRDDVSHHRSQAEGARAEAELAKERADRAAAEAELNEHKAAERERELKSGD